MTRESYNILYTMFLSQKLTQKINKKNDWRIVYNSIYYHSQSKIDWKLSKKNDWRIVYNSIYNDSQSKNSIKND